LGYMSPEQVKGEATDERSDLYSVGVSLYEMVTGQRPFQASSDYSIMAAHVKETPKPPVELQPSLPAALNEIILIAIAKDPAQRFQTADAFRNALSAVGIAPAIALAPAINPSDAATLESILPPAPPQPAMTTAPRTPTPLPAPAQVAKAPVPATPSIPIPPPQPGSHRGLYMTLGALIVLAVVVAAGIYMPRRSKTQAHTAPSQPQSNPAPDMSTASHSESQPAATSVPAPGSADSNYSAQPSAAPAMSQGSAGTNAAQTNATHAHSQDAHPRKLTAKNGAPSPAVPAALREADNSPASGNPAATATPASQAADFDELEHQIDQLSNRAAAVDTSLDRLQQQQNDSGYGLRGDIIAKHASLKNNLAKAQNALERRDAQKAKKYADLAQSDLEALEHFLGR